MFNSLEFECLFNYFLCCCLFLGLHSADLCVSPWVSRSCCPSFVKIAVKLFCYISKNSLWLNMKKTGMVLVWFWHALACLIFGSAFLAVFLAGFLFHSSFILRIFYLWIWWVWELFLAWWGFFLGGGEFCSFVSSFCILSMWRFFVCYNTFFSLWCSLGHCRWIFVPALAFLTHLVFNIFFFNYFCGLLRCVFWFFFFFSLVSFQIICIFSFFAIFGAFFTLELFAVLWEFWRDLFSLISRFVCFFFHCFSLLCAYFPF